MGLFSKLSGGDAARGGGAEQALLIHITAGPATDDSFLAKLAAELAAAMSEAGAGKSGLSEAIDGFKSIAFVGPDADALFDAAAPVIERHPLAKGSHAVKRYGGPGCSRTERSDVSWDG
ncbi:MAG: hypothetical protein Q8L55_00845 [Phycisphaerales bacterium]|nr:hypothetical protein [Phycisphaerales bacterium]